MPVSAIVPDGENPKRHSIDGLRASYARHGYVEPVTVDERTGKLISGHGRIESLLAAKEAGEAPPDGVETDGSGEWLVPVNRGWASVDDHHAKAALIGLNRLTTVGGWEDQQLADLLDGLRKTDPVAGLAGTGYSDGDLGELLAGLAAHRYGAKDPDEVPDPPTEPISKRGDLWLLGGSTQCPSCGHHNPLGR